MLIRARRVHVGVVFHWLIQPLQVGIVRQGLHLLAHVIPKGLLHACKEVDVSVRPHHMLVVQEVCLTQPWMVQRQDQIISLELINLIEVVANHERIWLIILRKLLPDSREVASNSFLLRKLDLIGNVELFVVHNEEEPMFELKFNYRKIDTYWV